MRESSACVDASTCGWAALTSASSSWVRASAPALMASSAEASSSSSRTTSPRGTWPACWASRASRSGRHGDLGRDLAERADDEQVARVGLEVAQERAGVAAALAELGRREQRPARVVRADRVERLEEQVGVGDAEHGEHVLERDRLPE
jgi:hypothetical protein